MAGMAEHGAIVVLDDHADTVDLLVDALADQGHTVEGYVNARRGLQRLLRAPAPRLLLLDYHLGDASGLDVLRILRAMGVEVPVLVITAAHPASLDQAALEALGVAGVLPKPFELQTLFRLIESAA